MLEIALMDTATQVRYFCKMKLSFSVNLISALLLLATQSSFGRTASNVLIFGKTIRQIPHGEILPIAGPALKNYLSEKGLTSIFTQDLAALTPSNLENYKALILLDVSESIFNADHKAAIEAFFTRGRGIVAVHATIAAGKDWPWLQNLIGTKFVDHAPVQNGVVRLKNSKAPYFSKLPSDWIQYDEWFNLSELPPSPAEVILLSDESSYTGGKMGTTHPIAWISQSGKGRFFYTSMGHPTILYTNGENEFLKLILVATQWATESH